VLALLFKTRGYYRR